MHVGLRCFLWLYFQANSSRKERDIKSIILVWTTWPAVTTKFLVSPRTTSLQSVDDCSSPSEHWPYCKNNLYSGACRSVHKSAKAGQSGVWSLKSARGCKSRTVPCLEPLALAGPGADHRPFSSLDHCISESRRQARPAVSDRPGPVARQELVRAEGNQDRTARSTDRRSETRPSRQPRDKERWNLDQTSGRTDHSSKTRPCRQTCTSEME